MAMIQADVLASPAPQWRPFDGRLNADLENGVAEGARTLDDGSHNPVLYQLSYNHH